MADVILLDRTAKLKQFATLVQSDERYSAMHTCARKHSSELILKAQRGAARSMGILALSGSPSFVAVMQAADLRQRHDGSHFRRLNRSWLRCVLPQRKMGSRSVIVIEIRMERSS